MCFSFKFIVARIICEKINLFMFAGQKFAVLEEKAVLSNLLRKYRWESVEKREDVRVVSELILRPLGGIFVKLKKK